MSDEKPKTLSEHANRLFDAAAGLANAAAEHTGEAINSVFSHRGTSPWRPIPLEMIGDRFVLVRPTQPTTIREVAMAVYLNGMWRDVRGDALNFIPADYMDIPA